MRHESDWAHHGGPASWLLPPDPRSLPLYRALFAIVAVVYPAWWPLSVYGMGATVDPLYERCLIGLLGVLGWFAASRTALHRFVPLLVEAAIYALALQYFSLVVRNEYLATLQVGAYISIAAIGLVPRAFGRTVLFAVVIVAVAALACWWGNADRQTWVQLFGGVATFELVALAITWRTGAIAAERARAEREALAAKDVAERAARSKDDLLARVSHELRTPMNGVINMLHIVHDSPLSPAQRGHIETADACARDMLVLVNGLLDLSKVSAGRMLLAPTSFSLAALLERALRELTHRATAKGILLQVDVSRNVPDGLVGDAQRLHQVLTNLLDNAIKFTARGAIAVTVARAARPSNAEQVRLAFSVADTGCGIAPDARGRIFGAFEQADGSTTRRYGGTGLGLTIAAELVDLMGGTLTVASELGVGSTFSFEVALPVASATQVPSLRVALAQLGPVAPAPVGPLRILVAEDNPTNQQVARLLLERAGHEVALANDGAATLVALADPTIDVLLLDVQMPRLDGFEVARRIRAGAVPGRERVPIIAVTAQAVAGDRERCLAAGMDAYLSKPIDRVALLDALQRATAGRGPHDDHDDAIDHADLARRLGDDATVLGSALRAFHDTSRALVAAIRQAIAHQCAGDLARDAHSLKGALLTIGAVTAARAAATLEELGQSARWGAEGRALAALEHELGRVEACIAKRYACAAPDQTPATESAA
ncbi:MAG: response regulator [Deltaproteobacteria bacterium]|nr:response regulator [Deltaproteobacteria bacterium]